MTMDTSKEAVKAPEKLKDMWDKWHIVASSFAILLVPVLVGYFGYQINASIKDKEISQRYVELAIGILKGDPDKESPALREWAISIVNANSPVQLNPMVRDELKRKPLRPVRLVQPQIPNANAQPSSSKVLIDEKGAFLTDEKGNFLTIDGGSFTSGGVPLKY